MQVHVHTDSSIEGGQKLSQWVRGEIEERLNHLRARLSRVEVFLSDTNQGKGGIDKRCSIEARVEGMAPLASSAEGETVAQALSMASEKIERALGRKLAKLNEKKGRTPMGGEPFQDLAVEPLSTSEERAL